METTRRDFLKAAGVTVAGLGAGSTLIVAHAKGSGEEDETAPKKRWAMVIDTNKCKQKEGCRACIDACHKIHNVPDIKSEKEEVKWVWKEPLHAVFPELVHEHMAESEKERPLLLMCNHCASPPCVRVCPTQATWKRESDGLVMMDMHRCIGCRYCIAACPYGSRSFNWKDPRPYIPEITADFPTRTKGVVEKCTFCAERLAEGKPPACVEACAATQGGSSLVFGDLNDPTSEVYAMVQEHFVNRRRAELGTKPQVYYIL